jgi:hypothetical protein
MTRLYVVVEGSTERLFVQDLMTPHLRPFAIEAIPVIVTTYRNALTGAKVEQGGGTFGKWKNEIRTLLHEQGRSAWITTLFDLYGLPEDFPDRDKAMEPGRAERLEEAMATAVGEGMPHAWRFIPYIQRHEFEALVLASLDALGAWLDPGPDREGLARLEREIRGVAPEDVNEGRETAPSKRLKRHVPGYRKTLHGPSAIELTGLAAIRARCPRFSAWISRLENLKPPS